MHDAMQLVYHYLGVQYTHDKEKDIFVKWVKFSCCNVHEKSIRHDKILRSCHGRDDTGCYCSPLNCFYEFDVNEA